MWWLAHRRWEHAHRSVLDVPWRPLTGGGGLTAVAQWPLCVVSTLDSTLAPAGLQHGLSLVWQRALQWPPLCRHFTHMPAVSEGDSCQWCLLGQRYMYLCLYPYQQMDLQTLFSIHSFFNIYFCIWLHQIFFVVCGLLSSGGTGLRCLHVEF